MSEARDTSKWFICCKPCGVVDMDPVVGKAAAQRIVEKHVLDAEHATAADSFYVLAQFVTIDSVKEQFGLKSGIL